jgi:hypothetical protein
MEDTYSAVPVMESDKGAFFGVYDGHGGPLASDYTADFLHTIVSGCLRWHSCLDGWGAWGWMLRITSVRAGGIHVRALAIFEEINPRLM